MGNGDFLFFSFSISFLFHTHKLFVLLDRPNDIIEKDCDFTQQSVVCSFSFSILQFSAPASRHFSKIAPMEVEVRRNTNRSAESQSGSTDSTPDLKVNKTNTRGTSGRRRSSKSLDSCTPSKKEPGAVIASHETNGDNREGLGVDVKMRVEEIERKDAINEQSTVSLVSTETGKWKGTGKTQAEDSEGKSITLMYLGKS
jgi:hypothetical protein